MGTCTTHFSAQVKLFLNTIEHGVEIFFEGLQQVRVYVGLREIKALVGKVEKEESSLPEELVPPPPYLLLKPVQLITEEVVHKELALKVRKHNPEANPYLHRSCRYYDHDLLDYPECIQEQDGSDPTWGGLMLVAICLPLHYESDQLVVHFLALLFQLPAHHGAVFGLLSVLLQGMQTLVGLVGQTQVRQVPIELVIALVYRMTSTSIFLNVIYLNYNIRG